MSLRVVLVSPYSLGVYGGVQEQVVAMSRELAGRGHEVVIIAPDEHDHSDVDSPATVQRFGPMTSLRANGSRAPLTLSPWAARRAQQAIRQFRPDVVHFHEPFAPLVGWATLRAHEFASVGTFHRSGDGPALRFGAPLLRHWARHLDEAAAVSEAAAVTIGRAARVHATVLFNGFDTNRFTQVPRERTDQPVVLTVGRLEERKGTWCAIGAVRAHNARGGDPWRLVIVGDGPQRAKLRALAGADPAVVFAGALDDAQKRAWLRRADVVVAPATRGESFGLVLLEAMASEAAVVASDIAGYREAAAGHATLFAPGDVGALEAAIGAALASDSVERRLAARSHAEQWSISRLVDQYEALYASARRRFGTRR